MATISFLLPVALLGAVCAGGQTAGAQTTGTSHPELLDDQTSTATTTTQVVVSPAAGDHYRKPSPAVPAETVTTSTTTSIAPATAVLRERVPVSEAAPGYSGSGYSAPAYSTGSGSERTFTVVGPAVAAHADEDEGIVTSVAVGPYELPIGTALRTSLTREISTETTAAGTPFRASLSQAVVRNGRVLLPAGTVVNGRITKIHGGRRVSGGSAIRLQADSITLPDGVTRRVEAEVSDLDHFTDSKVTSEGTIVSNGHGVKTAAVLGGTTGTAAIAGAMIGGGVGAVVGASVGAGVGLVWWLRQDRQQTLPQGTEIVFALDAPLDLAAGR